MWRPNAVASTGSGKALRRRVQAAFIPAFKQISRSGHVALRWDWQLAHRGQCLNRIRVVIDGAKQVILAGKGTCSALTSRVCVDFGGRPSGQLLAALHSGVTPEEVDEYAAIGGDHSDDDRGEDSKVMLERLMGTKGRKPRQRERLEVGQSPPAEPFFF